MTALQSCRSRCPRPIPLPCVLCAGGCVVLCCAGTCGKAWEAAVETSIDSKIDTCAEPVWLQGSDADNIIPDEVTLRGTLRALTHDHMMFIKQRIEQVRLSVLSFQKAACGLSSKRCCCA